MDLSLANDARTRLDFREEPGGDLTAILTLTLPGGIVQRYESRVNDDELEQELGDDDEIAGAGVAPLVDCISRGEAFRLARSTPAQCRCRTAPAVAGHSEIGRTSTDHLGPVETAHRKRLSWRALVAAKEPGKRPKDPFALMKWVSELSVRRPPGWKLDASEATINKWWNDLGHDGRKRWKIRYSAVMDHAPAGLDDDARNEWWRTLPKSKRDKWRDDAYTDFWEKAGKVAKSVVTSKVFLTAAAGLATAIPGLGPVVGPVALSAAAGLSTGAKLVKAGMQAERGAKKQAKALTDQAVASAKKVTKSPAQAKQLLEVANTKRKNVAELVAAGRPARVRPPLGKVASKPAPSKPASRPSSSPTARPSSPAPKLPILSPALSKPASKPAGKVDSTAVLAAARAGRLRSNKGGPVSPATLLEAHNAGRVFWIEAAA